MSSNDPFRLLELDRATATEADVKRAYAKRLKVTRPDDDPEGFMRLRQAFNDARQMLKWDEYDDSHYADTSSDYEIHIKTDGPETSIEETPPSDPVEHPDISYDATEYASGPDTSGVAQTESEVPDIHYDETVYSSDVEADQYQAEPHIAEPVPKEPQISPVDLVMNKLQAHFSSPWGAGNTQQLKSILNDPDIDGLDEFTEFSQRVRWALCEGTGMYGDDESDHVEFPSWLSHDVLKLLDGHFGWRAQQALDYNSRTQNAWIQRVFDAYTTIERGQARRSGSDFNPTPQTVHKNENRGFASRGTGLAIVWAIFLVAIFIRLNT